MPLHGYPQLLPNRGALKPDAFLRFRTSLIPSGIENQVVAEVPPILHELNDGLRKLLFQRPPPDEFPPPLFHITDRKLEEDGLGGNPVHVGVRSLGPVIVCNRRRATTSAPGRSQRSRQRGEFSGTRLACNGAASANIPCKGEAGPTTPWRRRETVGLADCPSPRRVQHSRCDRALRYQSGRLPRMLGAVPLHPTHATRSGGPAVQVPPPFSEAERLRASVPRVLGAPKHREAV